MEGELYVGLVRVLCDLQVLRIEFLGFHWNAKGPTFYMQHLLFERVYKEIDGYIDRVAECIRHWGRVPAALCTYTKFSSISEYSSVESADLSPQSMLKIASEDTKKVIADVESVLLRAEGQEGVINLLGDLRETLDNVLYLVKSGLE